MMITRKQRMILQYLKYKKSLKDVFVDGVKWADANPNWISVEEETPPIGKQILCVYQPSNIVAQGFYTSKEDVDFDLNNGWVSHWMLTPIPPEKEEEND